MNATQYAGTVTVSSGGASPHYFPHTGKRLDEETGLYYYGARYLDPQTSRWLSADPAMGEYIPQAPVNEEARKRNGNLPGMGGVFNTINLHVYHYAGNNPVKYIDPDGRDISVIIMHGDLLSLLVFGGAHAAVHFSQANGQELLYDPGGRYEVATEDNPKPARGSSGAFYGDSADLFNYIKTRLIEFKDDNVIAYTFKTTAEQESNIVNNRLSDPRDPGPPWCASSVSTTLADLGIGVSLTPGSLEKQLYRYFENGYVTMSVFTKITKDGALFIKRTDYSYDKLTAKMTVLESLIAVEK
jgi:RHS repeat-associated protein